MWYENWASETSDDVLAIVLDSRPSGLEKAVLGALAVDFISKGGDEYEVDDKTRQRFGRLLLSDYSSALPASVLPPGTSPLIERRFDAIVAFEEIADTKLE